jgi:hypothetical protein
MLTATDNLVEHSQPQQPGNFGQVIPIDSNIQAGIRVILQLTTRQVFQTRMLELESLCRVPSVCSKLNTGVYQTGSSSYHLYFNYVVPDFTDDHDLHTSSANARKID